MEPLLGFIVLTGPLFLIVLWVLACIALAFWVGRKMVGKSRGLNVISGLAIFLFALLLPIADEIAGRIYFNHLCETEAGTKVYQTIELPAEYWNEDGNPKFFDKKTGNLSLQLSQYAEIKSNRVSRSFGIEERQSILLDKTTHRKISDNPWFLYMGWVDSKKLDSS